MGALRLTRLALCALLAGCGGTTHPGALPSTFAAGTRAPASVRIVIPQKHSTASMRAPQYLSPATQSIAIVVAPAAGGTSQTFAANLTVQSGNCTSTLATTICTVSLGALTPGSYTGSFTTYDGPLNPSGAPAGTALSTNQNVPFTIVANQNNLVSVSLGGLPHGFLVAPQPNQPLALGSSATGYRLAGTFATKFQVIAQDADGNAIVGPGSPAYTISTTGSPPVTITQPVTTGSGASPNLFTLTPTNVSANAYPVTVTATYDPSISGVTCGSGGVVCTATVSVTNVPVVAMSESTTNVVDLYAGSSPTVIASFPTTVARPNGLAFDSAGNLFATDYVNNRVLELAAPYTQSPVTIATNADPVALYVDSAQALYVASDVANTIQKFTPPYTGSPATFNLAAKPYAFVVDAFGNIIVGSKATQQLVNLSPSGSQTSLVPLSIGGTPVGPILLTVRGSNVFVSAGTSAPSGVFVFASSASPPYTISPAIVTSNVSEAVGIGFDPAGNMDVANAGNNTVTTYAAGTYAYAQTIPYRSFAGVASLAVDGAANLYVGDAGIAEIFSPPYTAAPALISITLPNSGVIDAIATFP